jgi:hypothetical protein
MAYRIPTLGAMAALVLLAAAPGRGFQLESAPKDPSYLSPDHALRARVHTDSRGESNVRIEDAHTGAILLLRDDTSKDGAHGHAVVHGAWTPDSQFFVAGLESTGAHPDWAHPLWVYSRASNHVVVLSAIGITVVAKFQLRSPDILVTRVLSAGPSGRRSGQPFSMSLHTLLTKDRQQP